MLETSEDSLPTVTELRQVTEQSQNVFQQKRTVGQHIHDEVISSNCYITQNKCAANTHLNTSDLYIRAIHSRCVHKQTSINVSVGITRYQHPDYTQDTTHN
jgi:hypothetical protein